MSDLLHHCADEEAPTDDILRACIDGYLPAAWSTALFEARTQSGTYSGLSAELLVKRYATDKNMQRRVASFRAKGRTDVLEQLSWKLTTIVETSDLKALSKARAFSLESFERLLDDLPGDLAERAQLAFGSNKTAIGLLPIRPIEVLDGYVHKRNAHTIEKWMSQCRRRHRGWAVATGVADFLDREADLKVIRGGFSVRRNLGILLSQLDYPHDRRFARLLDRLDIRAILPNRTP